jgi:hypothetical protein
MLYCESHELVRAANLGRLALVLFHFWDVTREGGEGYWLHTHAAFETYGWHNGCGYHIREFEALMAKSKKFPGLLGG